MAKQSIVIIGGGAFGFAAALALNARGWQVTVLDQGVVPHPDGASNDISKVIRMDYGLDELYTEMAEEALAGWHRWNREWPRPLYHDCGYLLLTRAEKMSPGSYEDNCRRLLTKRGHPLELLDRAALALRFPIWNFARYGGGYFNANAGWAESGAVVAQLAALARAAGISVHEHAGFGAFLEQGSRVVGVRTVSGAEHRAEFVLSAVGAWTPFLLPELQPMLRATGHPVLHFKPANPAAFRPPGFTVWAADIANTGRYGFPVNADGLVKVSLHGAGTAILTPNQRREVSAADIEAGRAFLRESIPSLADAPVVSTRQCWYGDSCDGDYLIDHHPDRAGLVVLGGDSGHGFKFAPVLGDLIADVVERKPHRWAPRFRWRLPRVDREEARSLA